MGGPADAIAEMGRGVAVPAAAVFGEDFALECVVVAIGIGCVQSFDAAAFAAMKENVAPSSVVAVVVAVAAPHPSLLTVAHCAVEIDRCGVVGLFCGGAADVHGGVCRFSLERV